MAKRRGSFELPLPLRPPGTPAQRWLYSALRSEILSGRLRTGARLPATRDLAAQYGLARGTIVNAFEQLKAEGYLDCAVGSGTFVSSLLPEEVLQVRGESREPSPVPRRRRFRLSNYGRHVHLFSGFEHRPSRAFRCHLPALELFPVDTWAKLSVRRAHRLSHYQLMGCPALGFLPLRKAIAEYLTLSRGVQCSAEQVAIVSGAQEALDLVSRLLLNHGDTVCMEDPGYPGARFVFRAIGARIRNISLDEEGLSTQDLPRQGARLVYVTPGHQFPLAMTMSLARRLALLEWARTSGAFIFEDDYDGEFRYSGRPIPAMHGLDRHGVVLYAGSFSKVMFPALRLGYLVLPRDLIEAFEAAQSITTRHAPMADQVVLTDFIVEGHFGRHLRRMREVYAERLSVLLEEARLRLAGLLEVSNVEAGLQTTGWLGSGIDAALAAEAAARRNVEIMPLSVYGTSRATRGALHLGFAAVEPKEIRRGIRELAIVLESLTKQHSRRCGTPPNPDRA
jgi:GntR family transcriptional regulator/MocR family aminotransferase